MLFSVVLFLYLHVSSVGTSSAVVSTPARNQSDQSMKRILCALKSELDTTKKQLVDLTEKYESDKSDLETKNLAQENELLRVQLQLVQLSGDLELTKLKNTYLEDEMSETKSQVAQLAEELGETNQRLEEEQAQRQTLQETVSRLTADLNVTKALVNSPAQQNEMDSAQQQIRDLTQDVNQAKQSTQRQITALTQTVNQAKQSSQSQMTALSQEVSSLKQDSTTHVAFSVYLTSYIHPSHRYIIPFSGTTYNPNNDFSSSTNAFLCPVSGVYYFGFSLNSGYIPSGSNDRIDVTMRLTGDIVLSRALCINSDQNSNIYIQCSNSVVTQCDTGQSVWIQAETNNNSIYGTSSNKHSTFSGFLLWKT